MVLARICSACGAILSADTRGRCGRCAKPHRSGSSRPEINTSEWQKLRRAARLRDGNRCVRCGSAERLSVHHAVQGSNLLDDLLTLCSRCHARKHGRKPSAGEAVFLETNPSRPHARPTRVSSRGAE
jgi:5-methylcytosine-specific restriction endonuclease McrA